MRGQFPHCATPQSRANAGVGRLCALCIVRAMLSRIDSDPLQQKWFCVRVAPLPRPPWSARPPLPSGGQGLKLEQGGGRPSRSVPLPSRLGPRVGRSAGMANRGAPRGMSRRPQALHVTRLCRPVLRRVGAVRDGAFVCECICIRRWSGERGGSPLR
jgi:hypothetical protein